MNYDKQQLFQAIDGYREDMLALWRTVVNMESGPYDKAGTDAVAAVFQKALEQAGAQCRSVEFAKAGNMLIAEIDGRNDLPGILFLGHMDTALPEGTTKERPFTIKDGKAYGPGVLDMKGGIVGVIYAIKALKAAGYASRRLKVILAGDEEVLHAHSDAPGVFLAEAAGFGAAFNVETGFMDDGIVVGRKGVAQFELRVDGVAAHAGNDPENGRSAILAMSYKVIEIQDRSDWGADVTYNVGVIGGGKTSTAVPDFARILVDVRYQDPDDLPAIIGRLERIAGKTHVDGTSGACSLVNGIKPMKRTADNEKLFALVKKVSEENGFGSPYPKYVGGASDSAYTVLAGIPTVCAMGVKGARNHSPEEYAVVETLFERTKLLLACVLELDCGGQ